MHVNDMSAIIVFWRYRYRLRTNLSSFTTNTYKGIYITTAFFRLYTIEPCLGRRQVVGFFI